MKKNILYKAAVITAVIGLSILFAVILSGTAYPHMLFSVGTPLGLAFIFVSVILLFLLWLWEIYSRIKAKQYLWAVWIAVLGGLVVIQVFTRIR